MSAARAEIPSSWRNRKSTRQVAKELHVTGAKDSKGLTENACADRLACHAIPLSYELAVKSQREVQE
jgi:hypothetical protein